MKKLTLLLCLFITRLSPACDISITNSVINDEFFSINFTPALVKVLEEKKYKIDVYGESMNTVSATHSTYTDSSWLQLKHAVVELIVKNQTKTYTFKADKKCMMVACSGSDYKKSVIAALDQLKKKFPKCTSI